MTLESTPAAAPVEALRRLCAGAVHLPGDPGYDEARTPWNLAVDQRPVAVVHPADADQVREVVLAAAKLGLRVAAQCSGHNAGPLGPLDKTVLLRTSAMREVRVDPDRRTARVGAGVLWQDVLEPAAEHGLAALHGSSPNVGVVGFCLGGGIGWYGRELGLAANSVTAVEMVLGDGSVVRADHETNPELFWAVRGGGGSFGVVSAMEIRLFPISTAYAGMLLWDQADAAEVLRRWVEWTTTAPDCVTTSFRMLNLPPLPEIPQFVRGRRLVVVDGAVLADDPRAEEILAPLRDLRPELDTFARVPAPSLARMHMDPEPPTPGVSAQALLDELPEPAVDTFLSLTGPESGSSLLSAELRQLGGALGRPAEDAGALPMLHGRFVLFAVAIAATPELGARGRADAVALVDGLAAYHSGRPYLNFAENAADVRSAYDEDAWRALKGVRSAVDPGGVLMANHPVPRLYEDGRPTA